MFYRLREELDPTFQYQVSQGEFVFIEPNKSGKFITEKFEIDTQQVEDLKQMLREVKEEFLSLQFLQRPPCGQCDACHGLGFRPSKIRQYENEYFPIETAE